MKKHILALLILPTLAFAQSPEGQAPSPEARKGPTFEQFKQTMQPIIEHKMPAMQQTRECVSKSNSKEEIEKCMKIMADNARALREKMGAPAGTDAKEPSEMGKPPEGFVWNEETQKNMLKQMDGSIQQTADLQECLQKSNTKVEMGECMRSKMPARKQ